MKSQKKELTPMKTVIKTSIGGPFLRLYFILTAIALEFLALSPGMRAVTPPPDGGYPGANTAEGQDALFKSYYRRLQHGNWFRISEDEHHQSVQHGVGALTLYFNTGDENTANGAAALVYNTTGTFNTANGAFALFSNTAGSQHGYRRRWAR